MGEVAFGVRSEYAEAGYEGGALAVDDGTYHLGEALEKGNGYVVVDDVDTGLGLRLSEQPALEQVSVETAKRARKAAAKPVKSDDGQGG